jgi:N-methylhydantoinase A
LSKLIGVDVGGTFTDIVYYDTNSRQTIIHKVPTTSEDPSIGVLVGTTELCERNGIAPGDIDQFYHGTTIATNAVLENKGAKTGMVTTRGFRDIIHIGRHQRPQHYSIMQEIPWHNRPLVRREFRKVVTERIIPPKGEALRPLNEDEVRAAAREFRDKGVEAITVCFLFSYLNPAHERKAREILMEEYPDAFVTTSSEVSPQFREFERFTTAAMNAFIGPPVRDYVNRLSQMLRESGFATDLHIMLSNGGIGTVEMVSEVPIKTLLSGPAAGVLCGLHCGRILQRDKLITFDVGGTSADICVITDGVLSESSARDTWIAGFPVLVPMIDIHTIGAGGGSIAYVDSGGSFRVGPQSAGANPGPAAYGRGASSPTVTDANVVLRRLDRDSFLGGEMELDVDAASRVVGSLAEKMNMSTEEAAAGILTILNNNMANAIRSRTVQKGIDPRDYSLIAFGGAGPLHAAEVAAMLSIPEVIVPEYPGIGSALGLLTTDLKYDIVRTVFQTSHTLDLMAINESLRAMEETLLRQFVLGGVEAESIEFSRFGELRYAGQGYELRIRIPADEITQSGMDAVFGEFHKHHESEYGHSFPHMAIEIVNLRVIGTAPVEKLERPGEYDGGTLESALLKRSACLFQIDGKLKNVETNFYRRELLPESQEIEGPAVIRQKDSTTVIPPGCSFRQDRGRNLIIRIGQSHG